MDKKLLFKIIKYCTLFLFTLLFFSVSSYNKGLVENIYSKNLYKIFGKMISNLTGLLPFSFFEFILYFLLIFLVIKVIKIIMVMVKDKSAKKTVITLSINILKYITIIYFLFILVWGLNYNRLPLSKALGLTIKEASTNELKELCEYLILQSNELRSKMNIEDEYKNMFNRSNLGYMAAGKKIPELSGQYGIPKKVLSSEIMCYLGIAGIYFPFTGEANINIKMPNTMLPNTICHEMAHQRGFAREDEANYISYLTCISHPDIDFQYSGTLLALIHSMNALYQYDSKSYNSLLKVYSEDVRKDLKELSIFWKRYEGPVEETTDKINNAYLKANLQKDGTHSYGRMVDLLLAERRNKTK